MYTPGRAGNFIGVMLGGWFVFSTLFAFLALIIASLWALFAWSFEPLGQLLTWQIWGVVLAGGFAVCMIWITDRRKNGGRNLWDRKPWNS